MNRLSSGDRMEVESPCVVQDADVLLRILGWRVRIKILILEVQIELGASAAEYCSEEDDE